MSNRSKSLAAILAATCLSLTAPANANSEVAPDAYETTIAEAKSQMMADPASALKLARTAKTMAVGDVASAARSDLEARWLEGEALMRLNRSAEAQSLIDTALAEASASYQKEKIYADLLRSSASAKANAGKFKEALEHFELASERYFDLGDARSRAIVLQNIGSLHSEARDFEKAIGYYREAADIFTDEGPLSLSAHNNIGNALKGLEKYSEAETQFSKALVVAGKMGSPVLEARILTNMASVQLLSGKLDLADETAQRALELAEEHAPGWQPFVHGVLAQIELDRGNLAMAQDHIATVFTDQPLDKTTAQYREFHQTAEKIFKLAGNDDLAAQHKGAFERIERQASEFQL